MRSLLTLSVFLAHIREFRGEDLKVSLLPRFPQVFAGDDVTLICTGGNGPIKWLINGKEQSHKEPLMLLTTVTSKNNGVYRCERGGKNHSYNLTVLELEPYAQLSPSVGGAVMTKGDGRILVLQVEDEEEIKNWTCFVWRGDSGLKLTLTVNKKMNRGVVFADLKAAERATFWCMNKKTALRSNAVTLKMTERLVMLEPPVVPAVEGEPVALRCVVWGGGKVEKATFFKNNQKIIEGMKETYSISNATQADSGQYSCTATYRYSHISRDAAQKEGQSDPQEIKVIDRPPAAIVSMSESLLSCSCPLCPADCTSYRWYHTLNDLYARRTLREITNTIAVKEEGLYSCRMFCGNGFSHFSNLYSYGEKSETVNYLPFIMSAIVIILVGLILVLVALKKRRRGRNNIQETKQDKDKTTGGDYEQIKLKDSAVYHTLGGEGTSKDKAEGGYEALQKKPEDAVYHTLGPGEAQGQGEGQGGYQALKNVKVEVYQTLGPGEAQGQGEGQGGYQALKNVKAEVYQTLSSGDTEKPAGEAEGGYEQLPQKTRDYEDVNMEENPYEELKAEKKKEQSGKKKE